MKRLMILLGILVASPLLAGPRHGHKAPKAPKAPASSTSVNPHAKKDGQSVSGHQRPAPSGTKRDKWFSSGDAHPTGKPGSKPFYP